MADNIDISAGSGTTVATDNIGGVNYQRVKVTWGADGTATDASAAAPIPVVQTGTPSLPTDAATQTTAAALLASLGATTDAAVVTDANGTLNAHVRGALVELIAMLAVEGATTGAAVVTDANGTIQQYLRGLVKLWIAGPAASEAHIGSVGGTTVHTTGTMTRPADTTAYAAGDGVTTATSSASAMSIANAARVAAGGGIIFGGKATKSTTSTTNASFRIWIYAGTPSAIPNDNAAFTAAVQADYQTLIATALFDFANGIVGSDGVTVPITLSRINCGFKLTSGTALTVIWEARAAYTPGNAEVFRLGLDISQD